MSLPRCCLQMLIALLILSSFVSLTNAETCSQNIDCGTNTKYKYCNLTKHTPDYKTCVYCHKNSQCDINDGDVCINVNGNKWCEMKKLTDNFRPLMIITILSIFIGAFIAAGGGLGGGGIFVPIFILLLGFDTKSAAALSQATIFGGSMVNLMMNNREHHPTRPHRPLTDFNTILILEPMLLGGTVIGVLLNEILPDPLILACLMFVLIIAEYRMIKKSIRQWKEESAEINKTKLLKGDYQAINEQSNKNFVSVGPGEDNDDDGYDANQSVDALKKESLNSSFQEINDADDELNASYISDLAERCGLTVYDMQKNLTMDEIKELDGLIQKETQTWVPMGVMGCVWIIVSIFSLLRSGDMISIDKCSSVFWIFEFAVFPCLFVITFFIAKMNMSRYNRKLELKWKPADGDIEWNLTKSLIYPSIAAISGLLGGLLGIGGGMIVAPLLVELGVLLRVASATSAIAVLMTSSSSTFQKILLGMIRMDYMFFFMAVGVIGTFIGQTVVNVAIKKYGRNSIVVMAVASVIGCAIILMGANSIFSMTWDMQFDSICN